MALDNFYAAMPLIVERLRDQLPYQQPDGVKTIDAVDSLMGVRDVTRLCPALFVMPLPMDASDNSADSGLVVDAQEYQVTVCVAQERPDAATPAQIDLIAGDLAVKTYRALAGHAFGKPFQSLRYTGRGAPYYAGGYAEYPLFFSVTAALTL